MKIKFLNQKSAECAGSGVRVTRLGKTTLAYFPSATCAFCGKWLAINALSGKFYPHQWE
jgi:hypothetical protein